MLPELLLMQYNLSLKDYCVLLDRISDTDKPKWGNQAKKEVVLSPKISRVNFFYQLPARIIEYVSEYIFLIKKKYKKEKTKKQQNKQRNKQTRRWKAKETKEDKRISVKDLTGYDYIVREFALCTFNFTWSNGEFLLAVHMNLM